jgi:hypothetical protein
MNLEHMVNVTFVIQIMKVIVTRLVMRMKTLFGFGDGSRIGGSGS